MEKFTNRDMLGKIKGVCANDMAIVDWCNHQLELLDKKNSKASNKTQVENTNIANMLFEEMAKIGKRTTISELMENSEVIKNYVCENGKKLTSPKIVAVLSKYIISDTNPDGNVVRIVDKRKSYYSLKG